MIVSWPGGDLPQGRINAQYHHAIDVVPTLLTMIEADPPTEFQGSEPLAIQGQSFAYTFDHPDAPTTKRVQYFETLGDRAIWADGWKAVARHTPGSDYESDVWELYHAAEDFSEANNLAAEYPERLQALKALWQQEAERYDVLPLDDDTLKLYQQSVPPPRTTFVFYPGMARLDRLSAPDIFASESVFRAELSADLSDGVLVAAGDSSCGYEWFVKDGYLHFVYVYTRNAVYRGRSDKPVPEGSRVLGLHIRKTGETTGEAQLLVDDQPAGRVELSQMWPIYAANAGVRCGENRHAPISRDYTPPFTTGDSLSRIIVDVDLG